MVGPCSCSAGRPSLLPSRWGSFQAHSSGRSQLSPQAEKKVACKMESPRAPNKTKQTNRNRKTTVLHTIGNNLGQSTAQSRCWTLMWVAKWNQLELGILNLEIPMSCPHPIWLHYVISLLIELWSSSWLFITLQTSWHQRQMSHFRFLSWKLQFLCPLSPGELGEAEVPCTEPVPSLISVADL